MHSFGVNRSKTMPGIGWAVWGFLGGIVVGFCVYPLDFYTQLVSLPFTEEIHARLLGWVVRVAGMGGIGAAWAYLNRSQSEQMHAVNLGVVGPALVGAIFAINTPIFSGAGGAQAVALEISLISPSYAEGKKIENIIVSKKEYDWIDKEIKNTESLIEDFRELLQISLAIRRVLKRQYGSYLNDEIANPTKNLEIENIDLDIIVLVQKIKEKKLELSIMKAKLKNISINEHEDSTKSSFRENFIKGLLGRR